MAPIEHKGRLVVWKDDRGFGFIEPDDNSGRVFVHISAIRPTQRRPQEGDVLLYQLSLEQNGKLRALNASILGLSASAASPAHVSRPAIQNRAHRFKAKRLSLWLEVALLSALPLVGCVQLLVQAANPLPFVTYLLMSLVAFIAYSEDKSRARNKRWRISERNLHLLELVGGWMGGFIAQRCLRHKSRKSSYQLVFWLIVGLHQALWLVWLVSASGLQSS